MKIIVIHKENCDYRVNSQKKTVRPHKKLRNNSHQKNKFVTELKKIRKKTLKFQKHKITIKK